MSLDSGDLVVRTLRNADFTATFSMREWETLIRQSRAAGLLARVGAMLRQSGRFGGVPAAPAAHFVAESLVADAQKVEVMREAAQIMRGLQASGTKVVFLKGAGYLLGGLPAALGRLFSDIDVLVPKADLPVVEARLMVDGWAMTHLTAYDQHYYRAWMHELPPMQHVRRGTVLDIHHSILPQTARRTADAAKLLADALPLADLPGAFVLAPVDMVLHSMTHLFYNEEFSHGLRDLSDIDYLLRHFGKVPAFWARLPDRAIEVGLGRPLYYGLRHVSRVFDTPIPPDVVRASNALAPPLALRPLMDALWARALRTPHPTASDSLTAPALFLLYLRAHWFRMPLPMLIRHLSVKAWRRIFDRDESVAERP